MRRVIKFTGKIALAAAMLCMAGQAAAADANGKFVVRGVGGATCETYLQAIRNPAVSSTYVSWLQGYATATNQMTPRTYDITPTNDGLDFAKVVAVVCNASRQDSLQVAAVKTIAALQPVRQAGESQNVTVTADGKSVQIHQGALQILQAGLAAKKLFGGMANGLPSAELTKAIKAFQASEKLPVTGLPDIDTFIRAVVKR